MMAFDTCRMGSTVFTCACSDETTRKAMRPILQAYLLQREQDAAAPTCSHRLRKLRETAAAFETLQQVIDRGRLTVLPEGAFVAEPVHPISLQHVEDGMLANLVRFIITVNFEDGELTRPAHQKKAA